VGEKRRSVVDTEPETWRWVWLVASLFFLSGEMVVPGSFFLLPFGISAAVAVVLAFMGVPVAVEFVVFIVLGIALFYWFFKWTRNNANLTETPIGVGADRLVGAVGPVLMSIPGGPTESGRVRLGAEEWNAQGTGQEAIPDGAVVRVVEVRGTRVMVTPVSAPYGSGPSAPEGSD
jgi:membrane protein implicated in regulation of membrane protease activity